MKKYLLILFASFLLPVFSNAQVIEWQNTIGGSGFDVFTSITKTNDNGVICGGTSSSNISGDKTENSNGGDDYWIVKTNSIGDIQWQKTIGGSITDRLISIEQIPDGGYILGGSSNSNASGNKTENSNGVDDYWIVKTDSLGNILWQNSIGGSGYDILFSLTQTTDGGFILGGTSDSNISGDKTENSNGGKDFWIVKADSLGNIQWQNTIGGSGSDELRTIAETSDGGYILAGNSDSNISGDKTENSNGFTDFWIVKTDSLGVVQWQNTIGGSNPEIPYYISQTADGGYIVGGISNSNISGDKTENCLGGEDYWIVKTDSLGNILWQNTNGGSDNDYLLSISTTADGGYILGGTSIPTFQEIKQNYKYWG
ncbi:MAG: hypothetical protein IPP34_09005 [Bacteroidetes bacterium]|nr:hypothetical protein [Bacteroidota bacterium]